MVISRAGIVRDGCVDGMMGIVLDSRRVFAHLTLFFLEEQYVCNTQMIEVGTFS